jgi:hypothetical protein
VLLAGIVSIVASPDIAKLIAQASFLESRLWLETPPDFAPPAPTEHASTAVRLATARQIAPLPFLEALALLWHASSELLLDHNFFARLYMRSESLRTFWPIPYTGATKLVTGRLTVRIKMWLYLQHLCLESYVERLCWSICGHTLKSPAFLESPFRQLPYSRYNHS